MTKLDVNQWLKTPPPKPINLKEQKRVENQRKFDDLLRLIEKTTREVSRSRGVPTALIKSKWKEQKTARARFEVYYKIRIRGYSWRVMSRAFGVDTNSLRNGYDRHLEHNPHLRELAKSATESLYTPKRYRTRPEVAPSVSIWLTNSINV